jgi:hypothetical protein
LPDGLPSPLFKQYPVDGQRRFSVTPDDIITVRPKP